MFKIYIIILLSLLIACTTNPCGSDPTMDYKSLGGSGISPHEYDELVKQRQLQYDDKDLDIEV